MRARLFCSIWMPGFFCLSASTDGEARLFNCSGGQVLTGRLLSDPPARANLDCREVESLTFHGDVSTLRQNYDIS